MMDQILYKDLLKDFLIISRKYESDRRERGDDYNIFKVIHMTTCETRVHSAFIADLLNPKGLHGMGSIFLKLFLECLPIEAIHNIQSFDVERASVRIEFYIGERTSTHGGRLDIIIISKGQAIIIENKINAGEQENQMIRYHNFAEENYPNNYALLYLSLDGSVHNEEITAHHNDFSISTNKDFYTISYAHHIWNWLHLCREKSNNIPLLREGISHYINLIGLLTNKDEKKMAEIKDIANIFISNNEVVLNFQKFEKAVRQAKIELQRKFWHELIQKIRTSQNLSSYPMDLFVSDGSTNQGTLEDSIDEKIDGYKLKGEIQDQQRALKQFGISLIFMTMEEWNIRLNVVINIALSIQISIERNGNRLLNQSPDIPDNIKWLRERTLPKGWQKENYRIWGTYPKSFSKHIEFGSMSEYEYSFFAELHQSIDLLINDIYEIIVDLKQKQ